jgi:Protein of unknown function (DUF2924)
MELNVAQELGVLKRMTPTELRAKYREIYGEESRSGHKDWLIKRIIWRLQALAEGDLSERARRRTEELANDADLRTNAPRARQPAAVPQQPLVIPEDVDTTADSRVPMPGSVITRQYKGETLQVHVLTNGFAYAGEVYRTLSAVAKAITGTHTNGFLFFRMGKFGGAR